METERVTNSHFIWDVEMEVLSPLRISGYFQEQYLIQSFVDISAESLILLQDI